MGLRKLIEKQSIRIDPHQLGSNIPNDWTSSSLDIHIDKTTNTRINGKKRKVRIRIPLNTNRKIRIESLNNNIIDRIPPVLRKEIEEVFNDMAARDKFMKSLIFEIVKYDNILDDEVLIERLIRKFADCFELQWNETEIIKQRDKYNKYFYEEARRYYISLGAEEIKIGESDE